MIYREGGASEYGLIVVFEGYRRPIDYSTLNSLLTGCRGSSGRSLLPGTMYSGGTQSTDSGDFWVFFSGKRKYIHVPLSLCNSLLTRNLE